MSINLLYKIFQEPIYPLWMQLIFETVINFQLKLSNEFTIGSGIIVGLQCVKSDSFTGKWWVIFRRGDQNERPGIKKETNSLDNDITESFKSWPKCWRCRHVACIMVRQLNKLLVTNHKKLKLWSRDGPRCTETWQKNDVCLMKLSCRTKFKRKLNKNWSCNYRFLKKPQNNQGLWRSNPIIWDIYWKLQQGQT